MTERLRILIIYISNYVRRLEILNKMLSDKNELQKIKLSHFNQAPVLPNFKRDGTAFADFNCAPRHVHKTPVQADTGAMYV